jgi:hypothetical protein
MRKDEWTLSLNVDIGSPRDLISQGEPPGSGEFYTSFLSDLGGEANFLGLESSLKKGITP